MAGRKYLETFAYMDKPLDEEDVRRVLTEMGLRSPHVVHMREDVVENMLRMWRKEPRESFRIELRYPRAHSGTPDIVGVNYAFRHAPLELASGQISDPAILRSQPDRWAMIAALAGVTKGDPEAMAVYLSHVRRFVEFARPRWVGIQTRSEARSQLSADPPDMAWPITIVGPALSSGLDAKSLEWAGARVETLPSGANWVECGADAFAPNRAVVKAIWKFLPRWEQIRSP